MLTEQWKWNMALLLFLTSASAVINIYLNIKDDKVNIFCSSFVFSCLLVYNTLSHTQDMSWLKTYRDILIFLMSPILSIGSKPGSGPQYKAGEDCL